jgi:pyrroline-5-carboxylate reductase
MIKVLVLGAGSMVEAILIGLATQIDLSEWGIYSPSGISAKNLAKKVGARAVTDLSLVSDPEWILVGCKPQQLKELYLTLGGKFQNALYVSLLAAVSEKDQQKTLHAKNLIRVMPNLGVKFNQGVSLLSSESSSENIPYITDIFNKLGETLVVKEIELDELTLLTGSGPAFFYEFTKLLAQNFSSLDPKTRELLARKVLAGAAEASYHSNQSLDEMISKVTSKAGVTIAVLEEWRKNGMNDLIQSGILAGKKRTAEIKELLRS